MHPNHTPLNCLRFRRESTSLAGAEPDPEIPARVVDIDFFTRINDTHGHAGGDAVLRGVSSFVPSLLRATDVFARFGGKEFMLLLRETDLRDARGLAERVRVGVSRLAIEGLPADFRMALSAGVAEFVVDKPTEAWLKRADVALYRAKEGGRNRVEIDQVAEPGAPPAKRPVAT